MKHFPPFALAIFLTACAVTPEDQEAAHQRQLAKEARENFIAMKAQEHPDRPVVLHDEAPPATPKPRLIPFLGQQQPAAAPLPPPPLPPAPTPRARATLQAQASPPATPPPKPYVAARPTPQPRTARNNDETVYYWQVPPPPRLQTTPRQQAAEAKYARTLAKRPEDLTPEERLYAHEHY